MVKSHWKHWQNVQKLYCGRDLSRHVFFTLETDIWVQIGRRKVGLSGNILVKLYIAKSKFDVFDIKEGALSIYTKYEEVGGHAKRL